MCILWQPRHETLSSLGHGEREAIRLAEQLRADLVLIDERKGSLEAKRRGLTITGTLGVLLSARELRLIDPVLAYRRLLTETTFRTSALLEARFLGQVSKQPKLPGYARQAPELSIHIT